MYTLELKLSESLGERVGCVLQLREQGFFGNELPLPSVPTLMRQFSRS